MLKINRLEVNHLTEGCVTDTPPVFSFSLTSDVPGEVLDHATLRCGDWHATVKEQTGILYGGTLAPFTAYTVEVEATGASGETASASVSFMTGRLDTPWQARWITDKAYQWPQKTSPVPMVFRRRFTLKSQVARAWVNATALGIYDLALNGQRVSEDYFSPGFTSYKHHIQYQTWDVTAQLRQDNCLEATVAGGWAAGSFHYARKSHIATKHPALLLELHVEYADGRREVIATDKTWEVAQDGPVRMADWYDGEIYDATRTPSTWKPVDVIKPQGKPRLIAQYGAPVRIFKELRPASVNEKPDGRCIYDFGQNFAGVIRAEIRGRKGQQITFRHAEAMDDGELYVKNLRTAKATLVYTCREGYQSYSPRFTYMGFRYVEVSGVVHDDIQLTALVLCSAMEETAAFSCSDPLVNRLYENVRWSAISNFVDIPTDCPQRDERLGWTGDIAIFASTGAKLFDTSRFFDKWLRDLQAEQASSGGLPSVVPRNGDPVPRLPTACWGDSCLLVPWAEYIARGDLTLLRTQYPMISRYMKCVQKWAARFSRGKECYVWEKPFQYGDWCAPYGGIRDWMKRNRWIGTAYYANDCRLAAEIAALLGYNEDAAMYRELQEKVKDAYMSIFTDGNGKLLDEFQTGYVLPLAFDIAEGETAARMADNLAALIQREGGKLTTGFPATPYLLFALSDHGHADAAYQLLMQQEAPGWLYAVKVGGTTIWEQWAPVLPDGSIDHTKEASLNHYAYGAVADWFFRRMLGIEPLSGGYHTFRVAPIVGGGLTHASGHITTPYGRIVVRWSVDEEQFVLQIDVPVSTDCQVILPTGEEHRLASGTHHLTCPIHSK